MVRNMAWRSSSCLAKAIRRPTLGMLHHSGILIAAIDGIGHGEEAANVSKDCGCTAEKLG